MSWLPTSTFVCWLKSPAKLPSVYFLRIFAISSPPSVVISTSTRSCRVGGSISPGFSVSIVIPLSAYVSRIALSRTASLSEPTSPIISLNKPCRLITALRRSCPGFASSSSAPEETDFGRSNGFMRALPWTESGTTAPPITFASSVYSFSGSII